MDLNTTAALKFKPFELGQTVMTRAFLLMCGDQDSAQRLGSDLVSRHAAGDFGDLCESDRMANLIAIASQDAVDRVVSVYMTGVGAMTKVRIITERDRSTTTVMMADDY